MPGKKRSTPYRRIVLLFIVGTLSLSAKPLVNTSFWGDLALDGYDPVACFTESAAVEGKKSITAQHEGATYRFSTEEHRDLFLKNPEEYVPAYGGYCAWAVSAKNSLASVDIDTWQIVDGRLYLNYNAEIKKRFNEELEKHIRQANQNWPDLVETKGK